VAHEAIAECVTDALTTFWRLLLLIKNTIKNTLSGSVCRTVNFCNAIKNGDQKYFSSLIEVSVRFVSEIFTSDIIFALEAS